MERRGRRLVQVPPSGFAGFRSPPDLILLAVRWYLGTVALRANRTFQRPHGLAEGGANRTFVPI